MAKQQYEIIEEIMSFPSDTEFHTELNLISWHGKEAKIDIRRWSEGREKMSKGICLTVREFEKILENYGGKYNENRM